MALLNPSFEDPGTRPGDAAHWTLTSLTQAGRFAGFGAPHESAWEDFAWWPWFAAFDEVPVVRAFFHGGAEPHEAFEAGWLAGVYLYAHAPAHLVACPFGGASAERFEAGWLATPYASRWADVNATPALFQGLVVEGFEAGWRGNETYPEKWDEIVASRARFDGGVAQVEDFENAWPPAATL